LLEGLELLPQKELDYKGNRLQEFDLDAAIDAHPEVMLVDELAHTNAPGSRHPKRYQDVEELLASGIDVYNHAQRPASRELNEWSAASPASACTRRCRIASSAKPTK
jgi:two-component system sensor histidine kinase KdpD